MADGETQERIRFLETYVEQLKSQLANLLAKQDGKEETWALEEIEENLKKALQRLMNEEVGAQEDFDLWDKRFNEHPDKVARDAQQEAEWEEQQASLNHRCLALTQSFIPENTSSMSLQSLLTGGVPDSVANRIWSKKSLWLTRMEPFFIAKMHIADLTTKFAPHKLDLIELRAIYACLPGSFENDSSGEKKGWKESVRRKLKAAISSQDKLQAEDLRAIAYFSKENDGKHFVPLVGPFEPSPPSTSLEKESCCEKAKREEEKILQDAMTKHLAEEERRRRQKRPTNNGTARNGKLKLPSQHASHLAALLQRSSALKDREGIENTASGADVDTSSQLNPLFTSESRNSEEPMSKSSSDTVPSHVSATTLPNDQSVSSLEGRKTNIFSKGKSQKISALLTKFESKSTSVQAMQFGEERAKEFQVEAEKAALESGTNIANANSKSDFMNILGKTLSTKKLEDNTVKTKSHVRWDDSLSLQKTPGERKSKSSTADFSMMASWVNIQETIALCEDEIEALKKGKVPGILSSGSSNRMSFERESNGSIEISDYGFENSDEFENIPNVEGDPDQNSSRGTTIFKNACNIISNFVEPFISESGKATFNFGKPTDGSETSNNHHSNEELKNRILEGNGMTVDKMGAECVSPVEDQDWVVCNHKES